MLNIVIYLKTYNPRQSASLIFPPNIQKEYVLKIKQNIFLVVRHNSHI